MNGLRGGTFVRRAGYRGCERFVVEVGVVGRVTITTLGDPYPTDSSTVELTAFSVIIAVVESTFPEISVDKPIAVE